LSKNIKLKRVESILKEILDEAFVTLNDSLLRSLVVIEVDCKRGKYDADVYLDKSFLDEEEQRLALKRLKKVRGYLENYTLQNEGWFRCPKFHFKFYDKLEKERKYDELFSKIESELKNGS